MLPDLSVYVDNGNNEYYIVTVDDVDRSGVEFAMAFPFSLYYHDRHQEIDTIRNRTYDDYQYYASRFRKFRENGESISELLTRVKEEILRPDPSLVYPVFFIFKSKPTEWWWANTTMRKLERLCE